MNILLFLVVGFPWFSTVVQLFILWDIVDIVWVL